MHSILQASLFPATPPLLSFPYEATMPAKKKEKTQSSVKNPVNARILERLERLFPEKTEYQFTVWKLLDLIEDIQQQKGSTIWPSQSLNGYFDGTRDALRIHANPTRSDFDFFREPKGGAQ